MLQHIKPSRARVVLRTLFAGLSLGMILTTAHADLVKADWKSPGDQLIVRDTVTGLEFLSFHATFQKNHSYVDSQLGAGGYYEGFRRLTHAEVNAMLGSNNLPLIPPISSFSQTTITLAELERFQGLFGMENWGYGPQSYAFTSDSYSGGQV